jgi:hypothetical protein
MQVAVVARADRTQTSPERSDVAHALFGPFNKTADRKRDHRSPTASSVPRSPGMHENPDEHDRLPSEAHADPFEHGMGQGELVSSVVHDSSARGTAGGRGVEELAAAAAWG